MTRVVACIGAAHWDTKAQLGEPVVLGSSNPASTRRTPGGVARNVAESLARLGCSAALFSAVGDDAAGPQLTDDLAGLGVDTVNVRRLPGHPTASYTAVLEPDGSLVLGLADMQAYEALDATWADHVAPALAAYDLWVIDANLTAAAIERLLRHHKGTATVIADPVSVAKAPRLKPVLDVLAMICPDVGEAATLTGRPVDTPAQAQAAATALRQSGVGRAVVSLGADGVSVADAGGAELVPAFPAAQIRDVTGAGDAFVAGYVFALASSEPDAAVRFGLAAASLTVEVAASVDPELSPARLRARANLRNAAE